MQKSIQINQVLISSPPPLKNKHSIPPLPWPHTAVKKAQVNSPSICAIFVAITAGKHLGKQPAAADRDTNPNSGSYPTPGIADSERTLTSSRLRSLCYVLFPTGE